MKGANGALFQVVAAADGLRVRCSPPKFFRWKLNRGREKTGRGTQTINSDPGFQRRMTFRATLLRTMGCVLCDDNVSDVDEFAILQVGPMTSSFFISVATKIISITSAKRCMSKKVCRIRNSDLSY